MQLLLILLSIATINPLNCDKEFIRTYKLAAEWIYPENMDIGPLIEFDDHNCNGWLPANWNPGRVAVRPLYEDSGLPLYDIFEDEWEVLVGFEFRSLTWITRSCKLVNRSDGYDTWCCWEDERELWRGYSIALTERDKFLYYIMD